MVVAVTAPPLASSRTNHKARLLLSPVFGESIGLAVPFVPVPALGLAVPFVPVPALGLAVPFVPVPVLPLFLLH